MGIRQKKTIRQRDLWSGGELLEGRECLNAKSKLKLNARVDLAGDCGRKHPGTEERAHATGQSMGVTTIRPQEGRAGERGGQIMLGQQAKFIHFFSFFYLFIFYFYFFPIIFFYL